MKQTLHLLIKKGNIKKEVWFFINNQNDVNFFIWQHETLGNWKVLKAVIVDNQGNKTSVQV